MHVLIIGAAGMIGRKLAESLVKKLLEGAPSLARLTLADLMVPTAPKGLLTGYETVLCGLTKQGAAERLLQKRPDIVFHLAAVVAGEAESGFGKSYNVNLN